MTGAVSLPTGRFPVFSSCPTTDFVRRWHRHIERTGAPEKFEFVSTDRPVNSEGMFLLSDDVRVPVQKREGGSLVPCPVCSPNSPKFAIGRMAWFPAERAVRFIGHDCAARHFQEDFKLAEVRFRGELMAVKAQELWADIGPNVHWLLTAAVRMKPVAKALQECRSHFGWGEQDFAPFFNRVQAGVSTVPLSADRYAKTGELAGMAFVAPGFKPLDALEEIRAALEDARIPLPAWEMGDGAAGAVDEIIARGERLQAALKAFPALLADIRAAREFLTEANFLTFRKWFASGKSPFGTLDMTIEGGTATVKASTFWRQYSFTFDIPKTTFGILPSKADVHFRRTSR